jgi:hypothetical protein
MPFKNSISGKRKSYEKEDKRKNPVKVGKKRLCKYQLTRN